MNKKLTIYWIFSIFYCIGALIESPRKEDKIDVAITCIVAPMLLPIHIGIIMEHQLKNN